MEGSNDHANSLPYCIHRQEWSVSAMNDAHMFLAWPLRLETPSVIFLTKSPRPCPSPTPGTRVPVARSREGYGLSLGQQGQGLVTTVGRRNPLAAPWRTKLARGFTGGRLGYSEQSRIWIQAGRATRDTELLGTQGGVPSAMGFSLKLRIFFPMR